MAGETVYARVGKQAATVTAAFEFEDWETRDEKFVYFPVFAEEGAEPLHVLAHADIEFEIDGKKGGVPAPCEAPIKSKSALPGIRVFWFAASLDDLVGGEFIGDYRFIVRLSYSQPLIGGRFYYLPVIVGQSREMTDSWKYQMIVRSELRPVRLISASESQALLDLVTVHLKDGEIVSIE